MAGTHQAVENHEMFYLGAANWVLSNTDASTRVWWQAGRRVKLPDGVPYRFVGRPVLGPQCVTVTLRIRDEDWKAVEVRVGGRDPQPGSGLQATYLQVGDTRWQQVIPGGVNGIEYEGVYDVRAYGRDGALNRSPVAVEQVKIDRHPPTLEALYSSPATSSGWYTAPLSISVRAEDVLLGVAQRWIRVGGGAWLSGTLRLEGEGEHGIEYAARDVAGNDTQTSAVTVRLDLAPPAGAMALNGVLCQTCSPATVSVGVGDSASGVAHWALSLGDSMLASGSDPAREVPLDGGALPPGDLTLRLEVQDVAGWLRVAELVVTNAPYQPGPTPTAWAMVTATPCRRPRPGRRPRTPPSRPPRRLGRPVAVEGGGAARRVGARTRRLRRPGGTRWGRRRCRPSCR
jgi:hypothetical protein